MQLPEVNPLKKSSQKLIIKWRVFFLSKGEMKDCVGKKVSLIILLT